MKYPLAEQSLLLVQCTGVTYTRDCLSHAVGLEVSRACPLCGMDDSRLHRAKFCEAVADLRAPFLASLGARDLPEHTWAYGLWDEPSALRVWQADTCGLGWPLEVESSVGSRQFVFTDGSCLSPRNPMLSIAGGSVILAHSNGQYEVVWSGLLPGLDQSSFRAELLAITVALASFSCVTVFCDNFQVVAYAEKLLRLPVGDRCDHIPVEHQDLWRYFCRRTKEREWGNCVVRWVKAQQDVATLTGNARILATFNSYADAEARKVVVRTTHCIRSCSCPATPIRRRPLRWRTCTSPLLTPLLKLIAPGGFVRTQLAFRWSVWVPGLLASKLVPRSTRSFLPSWWDGCRSCGGIPLVPPVGLVSRRLSCCGSSFSIPVRCPLSGLRVSGAQLRTPSLMLL